MGVGRGTSLQRPVGVGNNLNLPVEQVVTAMLAVMDSVSGLIHFVMLLECFIREAQNAGGWEGPFKVI